MQYELDYFDQSKITVETRQIDGETYILVGGDKIIFHVEVPDYNAPSNVARDSLPEEFSTADAMQAIVYKAHIEGHLSRDGKVSYSPFPQFPAQFKTAAIAEHDGRRAHALWLTRLPELPSLKAA
ncbi:MAG: hypothetical protein AAF549_02345 [Pseudomonadota bacterium]